METSVTDQDTIAINDSLREPHVSHDDQQGENITQTQSDVRKVIKMAKKGPMNPTPLYVSLLCSIMITYILFFSDNILGVQHIQLK